VFVPNYISTSCCGLICVLSVVCHMFLTFVCYKSCISRFDVCLLLSQVFKNPVWLNVCFDCFELCNQKSSMVWCVFCLLRVVWSKIQYGWCVFCLLWVVWSKIQYGLMSVLSVASRIIKKASAVGSLPVRLGTQDSHNVIGYHHKLIRADPDG